MKEVISEMQMPLPKFFSLLVNTLTYFVVFLRVLIVTVIVTFLKTLCDLITNWK